MSSVQSSETRTIVELTDFPGYGVDTDGNVYCNRPINGRGQLTGHAWRLVKPIKSPGRRYAQVTLYGYVKKEVHVLVARAFHGTCPEGMEVAHDNGDSFDNRSDNLKYLTHQQNEAQKVDHGTSTKGESNGMAKLTDSQCAMIRQMYIEGDVYMTEIAATFGISVSHVSLIVNNKRRVV